MQYKANRIIILFSLRFYSKCGKRKGEEKKGYCIQKLKIAIIVNVDVPVNQYAKQNT